MVRRFIDELEVKPHSRTSWSRTATRRPTSILRKAGGSSPSATWPRGFAGRIRTAVQKSERRFRKPKRRNTAKSAPCRWRCSSSPSSSCAATQPGLVTAMGVSIVAHPRRRSHVARHAGSKKKMGAATPDAGRPSAPGPSPSRGAGSGRLRQHAEGVERARAIGRRDNY